MSGFGRWKKFKFFTVIVFVIACWSVTKTHGQLHNPGGGEVLTDLEQRMLKNISVDFRATPIEDVLRILADQADVDIVKGPAVVGDVTATLTDVPLQEALNNILAAHGYGYVADRNMIRIALISELTGPAERLVNKIYRITYADVGEVERALRKFISGRGSLSSNPGTSNIIVTDTESKIKAIDAFIDEIDRITPQILVEARIYDITSKDSLDLGIEWQVGRNTNYGIDGITGVGANPTGQTTSFITGAFGGATGKTSGTGALRFGWLEAGIDLDVLLKAQENKINAKLLANPRILVLDNETAKIKIITEIPYQELTETSAGGSMGTTSFREVGVELEVVPHLTRDEMIRLYVKPKFSVRTGDVEIGFTGDALPQPVVDKREIESTLLLKSGQTVVLGGLRKKEVTQQVNKIPLLGDLPLLGMLFRFEGEDTVNSELVVFITPWIVEQPVLSELERSQYEVTEFPGPAVTSTRAEDSEEMSTKVFEALE